MILKNLLGRKVRTLLTIFGIAVGVAAVVALGALSEGFLQGYSALAGGSGADLLVVQKDALDIAFSSIDQGIGDTLAGFAGVADISEMIYTFSSTDGAQYFIIYGYDPDEFAIEHFKIVEGVPLSQGQTGQSGNPLLLGKAAADSLKKHVGDTLRLYESSYRIVGIYETGEPFEDGGAVLLLEDAQTISGKPHQINAFLLKVREDTDLERLSTHIEQRFDNLTASKSSDFAKSQETLQYTAAFTWSVSFVAILIGAVGVMNTMLMSVFERTNEFGVLRAVGWRPHQVLRMVLGESLLLSVIGGAAGIGIGIAAIQAVQSAPTIGGLISSKLSPTLLGQATFIAVSLGVVGGGLPAWRASRLTPAEAMRSEGAATGHAGRHVRSSALRNVMRQPTRTLLTIVGIGIAILAMVLLGALGDGVVEAMLGMISGSGAQLAGIERDASVDLSKIDQDAVRRIASMPGVETAEGFLTGYTTLGDLPFFIVLGYQPRGYAIREFKIVEGTSLATNHQIILGRVAAENLDKDVGQTLRLFNQAFKIVGIYETGVTFQDGGGVITLRDAQRMFGQPRKVSFMSVWVESPEQAEALAGEIEARYPEISLSPMSDFAEDLSDIQMMQAATWAVAMLALVVGGLGMANTMVMSVFERTREIGVLRALGWRKRRVLWMIIRESIVLSLLGGVTGTLAGVGLGYALNLNPIMQGMFKLQYSPDLFAQALGTTLILGVVGGVYPAWRASRMPPVEALRYE